MTAHTRDRGQRSDAAVVYGFSRTSRRTRPARQAATIAGAAAMAAAAGILLSAAAATVKLVGVSAHGNAVLIEATEPVAYSVDRPDPLTLIVDMRNVSVGEAKNDVSRQGPIAGVQLEQTNGIDGRAVARVRLSLSEPAEYRVRSARNMIRVELSPVGAGATPAATPRPASSSRRPAPAAAAPKPVNAAAVPVPVPSGVVASPRPVSPAIVPPAAPGDVAPATVLERVLTSRSAETTTVTLAGDGLLAPARVTESEDAPRRLVLDFPNVGSIAPAHTEVNTPLVRRVRVGLNSREPLVTRVVMEIDRSATYHVERAGDGGRDLAVVFGRAQAPATVMVAPPELPAAPVEPEAPISIDQAIANAAAITPSEATPLTPAAGADTPQMPAPAGNVPPEPSSAARMPHTTAPAGPPADPMTALNLVAPPLERQAEPVERPRPSPPPPAAPPPQQAPAMPPPQQAPAMPPPQQAPAMPPPQQAPAMPPQQQSPAMPLPRQTPPMPSTGLQQPPAPTPQVQTPPPTAPTQPPAPAQGQPVPGQAEKKYTGHPISMDFQGVDLRAVLRAFAEPSGLNFIIDPDVQGSVDMVLTEVPWDQALEVILRANQLDYTVDGTIVRIARIETLKRENDARQALAKSVADAGTLQVRTFSLSYARAAASAPLIKRAALSPRGDVQIDDRTNTLIITDLPAKLDMAANLIATIDRAEPQVEVEARIVQTTRDFARALGVQWGLNGRMSPELGNTTNLAFPNRGSIGGRVGGQQGAEGTDPRGNPIDNAGTAINLAAPAATSAIGLALGAVNGAFNLDVALSALESSGKGRVLSTPRLTTQNNIQAEVSQGIQIPIQTVANNTVTVTFKDAVLVLRVTPQITAANTVIMKVEIENATADFSREVNGIPPIDTQRALTQVQINDGATTVIGGIFVTREQSSTDRTPMLHRIPLVGWLFRRDVSSDESRELLIFITPRILKG